MRASRPHNFFRNFFPAVGLFPLPYDWWVIFEHEQTLANKVSDPVSRTMEKVSRALSIDVRVAPFVNERTKSGLIVAHPYKEPARMQKVLRPLFGRNRHPFLQKLVAIVTYSVCTFWIPGKIRQGYVMCPTSILYYRGGGRTLLLENLCKCRRSCGGGSYFFFTCTEKRLRKGLPPPCCATTNRWVIAQQVTIMTTPFSLV